MRTASTTEAEALFANSTHVSLSQLIQLRHLSALLKKHNQSQHANLLLNGSHLSPRKGRGMDFDEVRLYQPGDDIRNIDWRVTARSSKPHTKIYKEEKERPVLFFLDQSQSMFFGSRVTFKSVLACEINALLAWHTLANNDKVGGIVLNDREHLCIATRRSKQGVLQLLKSAADFNQALNNKRHNKHRQIAYETISQPDNLANHSDATQTKPSLTHWEQALQQLQNLAHHGSTIYILSDFYQRITPFTTLTLRKLSQHNRVILIHINDLLEQQLPQSGGWLTITNGQQQRLLNCDSGKVRNQYQSLYQQQIHQLQTLCLDNRLALIEANTQTSPLHCTQSALLAEARNRQ